MSTRTSVDLRAVDALGARMRFAGTHADAGLPAGVGGCGAPTVVDAWDEALALSAWALHERLGPAVALWGAAVEAAGLWCEQRDRTLAQHIASGGAGSMPVSAVLPAFRSAGAGIGCSGPQFGGSPGGAGPVWAEDDPGRGDLDPAAGSADWVRRLLDVTGQLDHDLRRDLSALADAWQGPIADALNGFGTRVAGMLTRLVDGVDGRDAGLTDYTAHVADVAERAVTARARLGTAEDALAAVQREQAALPTGPGRTDADRARARALTDQAWEARDEVRAANRELDDLADERMGADDAAADTGRQLTDAVRSAVPPGDEAFDTISGLAASGLTIGTVGYRPSAATVHLDAERDAVQALLDADEGGYGPRLQELVAGLADGTLRAEDLIAVLLGLSTADRRRVAALLERRTSAYPHETVTLSSALLAAAASPYQVALLTRRYPFLEPTGTDGSPWAHRLEVEAFDPASISARGLSQGDAQDCWFIAGIGAVAAVDIEAVRRNIRANPNGTYTVTVYRDGKAVAVTVSGFVAGDLDDEGRPRTLHAGTRSGADRQPSWVSIYEKAAAQVLGDGGYAGLTAGRPGTGISAITGKPTETLKTQLTNPFGADGEKTLDTIRTALADGRPISALVLWNGTDTTIAPWHVYYVSAVEGDTIVVRNPWGRDGQTALGTLRLSGDEFLRTFAWANIGQP